MNVYCLKQFKSILEKLLRKNNYSTIELDIIEYFFNKEISELQNGTRLNGNSQNPYIKKRLDGRGGFRIYFLLIIKNDSIYLMHIHPKTGPLGMENISDELKKSLYKEIIQAIESNNLFRVQLSDDRKRLIFDAC